MPSAIGADAETANLAASVTFNGEYARKHLQNPEPIQTNGAFGTIYKAEFNYKGQFVPVIIKYQFCKT
jgi:hypothetical protein